MSDEYSNRELDEKFEHIKDRLDLILQQTTKTNGRVNILERNLLVIACIVGTFLVIYFPQILDAIKLFL
jgi:hypothetical protein